MTGVATIAGLQMRRWLPRCLSPACLRMAIGACRRRARKDTIGVAGLAFGRPVRAFEAKTGRKMVESGLRHGF